MTHSFLNKQGLTHFWELIKSKIPFHLTKVLYGGLGNIIVDENGNTLVDENGNTITAGATTSLTVNNIEDNSADAAYSTAMGDHTIATKKGSLAVGNYNQTGDYLFVVGNGNSSQRSNAFMVMSNDAAFAGKLSIGAQGTADNNVVTKKYVDDAIGDVNNEVSSSIDDINDEIDAIHDEIEFKFRNTIRCESITLNQTSVTGWVGSPVQITSPTLSPSDTTDTVRWKSNDVSVANVTSTGAITGISAGYTTITVMCGDRSGTINAAVYQELPKTIGLLGYGSWDSSGSLYNINYSVTRGYTLAYNEYPIRPGQTVKIEITDGTRYALYDCGIYTGTPNIVELPQYTVVQHQNINRQTDLGSWWDVGTRSWKNTLSENAYLYICVAFRGGVDGRSDTTDAVTQAQLEAFQNGNGMKIWIEPENPDQGGTGVTSITLSMTVHQQAIDNGSTYANPTTPYLATEQTNYWLQFPDLADIQIICTLEMDEYQHTYDGDIYAVEGEELPSLLTPYFQCDLIDELLPCGGTTEDHHGDRIIVNMDVTYAKTGKEYDVEEIYIDPITKGLPTQIDLYYSIITP